jgi:hypothetical protein
MTILAILAHWPFHRQRCRDGPWTTALEPRELASAQPSATTCPAHRLNEPLENLPSFVQDSAVARRYFRLLGPLPWSTFPERDLLRNYGPATTPYAPFAAACLVKLDQYMPYMSQLRDYLVEHPALTWLLGFPLPTPRRSPNSADVDACLPTARHLTRMLRTMPNTCLQFLLDGSVQLLQTELVDVTDDDGKPSFGQAISLDTKHILAWVKENNPKAYLKRGDRYDKTKQPAGDPDCRLGCKRRRNQRASSKDPPPTPRDNPVSANTISVGEYYWGYASGVVATKVPEWGEFVLAELTQSFDHSDVSYFFPLMAETERRLGFRPRYGAFDAAFDAFYVYEHFHREEHSWMAAFAAVPFSPRGGHRKTFDEQGLPLCPAGLPMPLKYTFTSRTGLFPHPCARYVCPLCFPKAIAEGCPIEHKQWAKGGCTTTMATSIGARLRYQIDRESETYKQIYRQRTATERVNSQAVALGIERPRLRNGAAITNQNTLIYVLINLRALRRVRERNRQTGA